MGEVKHHSFQAFESADGADEYVHFALAERVVLQTDGYFFEALCAAEGEGEVADDVAEEVVAVVEVEYFYAFGEGPAG